MLIGRSIYGGLRLRLSSLATLLLIVAVAGDRCWNQLHTIVVVVLGEAVRGDRDGLLGLPSLLGVIGRGCLARHRLQRCLLLRHVAAAAIARRPLLLYLV